MRTNFARSLRETNMAVALITGSGGLIGSAATRHFAPSFERIVGIDNDMRSVFFGPEASTQWKVDELQERIPNYVHHGIDIRDLAALERVFQEHGRAIRLIISC